MPATQYPEIPWPVTEYSESLPTGHALGMRYVDRRGRIFALWQIGSALTNDTTATGEVMTLMASHVVTNDVSTGLDATSPIFAGVALGSFPESTSGGTTRYGLFLTKGRCTLTVPSGTVDVSDLLTVDPAADGGAIELDETATNLAGAVTTSGFVGVALASESGNAVDAFVSSAFFG